MKFVNKACFLEAMELFGILVLMKIRIVIVALVIAIVTMADNHNVPGRVFWALHAL